MDKKKDGNVDGKCEICGHPALPREVRASGKVSLLCRGCSMMELRFFLKELREQEQMEFVEFPKIARLIREIIITEKIDGTNAQVFITDDGEIRFGSRTRWITPENDNFGFAKWGTEHRDELILLGPGRHFGEWWGQGIQRKYGLSERRFSLFNVSRWNDENIPGCCRVVPMLYKGIFSEDQIHFDLLDLLSNGSKAEPGWMNPEGIVIYHTAAGICFKKTLENDDEPKSKSSRKA